MLRYESDVEWERSEALGIAYGFKHLQGVAIGAPSAIAYVNGGRWIADCAFGCGGAREVSPTVNYWCACCGNSKAGGQEVLVQWPDEADDITSVLLLRPSQANRNWSPTAPVPGRNRIGEDVVTDLAVENLERGLSVPIALQSAVDAFVEADWAARGLADEMKDWQGVPAHERVNPLRGPKGDKGDPGEPGPPGPQGPPGVAVSTPVDPTKVRG